MSGDNGAYEVYASSINRVASVHAINRSTVQEWLADGMPGKTENGYPVGAQFRWRLDRSKPKQTESSNGEPPRDPKSRKDYFQAELARLKFETATGKLVAKEEHDRVVNKWSAWFVDSLSQLPGATAPVLAGKSAAQIKKSLGTYCKNLQEKAFGEVV